MRLGVSTSFTHSSPEDWLEKNKNLKLKSVVFPVSFDADESLIQQYAKLAVENDITIAEVGIWRNTLSADSDERKKMTEYAINQLRLADKIGAKCCVNVAGTPHGLRWDGGYRKNFDAQTRKEIIRMVRTIIDEASPVNTTFSLESMPWMVPTGPDDYLQLIDEIERDAFSVHLDFINMINSAERYFFIDEFMDECLEKLGNRIVSCHLKDIKLLDDYTFQLRECAPGEGVLDTKKYIEKLNALNPEMPVIIEHLNSDEAYVESVKYVQNLCAGKGI